MSAKDVVIFEFLRSMDFCLGLLYVREEMEGNGVGGRGSYTEDILRDKERAKIGREKENGEGSKLHKEVGVLHTVSFQSFSAQVNPQWRGKPRGFTLEGILERPQPGDGVSLDLSLSFAASSTEPVFLELLH